MKLSCQVVSLEGALLGESLSTQQAVSTSFGGIIPTFARHFHEKKIEGVVQVPASYCHQLSFTWPFFLSS